MIYKFTEVLNDLVDYFMFSWGGFLAPGTLLGVKL